MAEPEHLVIDHVGHRGDGVVMAGGLNIYVPYALGAKRSRWSKRLVIRIAAG